MLGRYGKVLVIWVFIINCTSQIQTCYAILLKFNRFDYLWALLEKTIRKKREILHEKISHWLMKPSKFSSHAGYFLQIFVNQKRCFFRRHENWIWLHNWFLICEFTIRYKICGVVTCYQLTACVAIDITNYNYQVHIFYTKPFWKNFKRKFDDKAITSW